MTGTFDAQMTRARRYMRALVIAVAAALCSAPAFGQVVGANLGGTVTDETGSRLPGVTITITNRANGRQQVLVSGSQGEYRAVALQPAPYVILVELTGFATQRRELVLTVGSDTTIDFKLGIQAVEESVTVSGSAPLVEVSSSQPSSVVVGEQIAALPVIDRQFLALAQLLPGAGPNTQSQRYSTTKFGGSADHRNGFTTLIDGGTIDDAVWGSPTINITQDAVQEFKVFRNQFDAQYGSALSAVVTVVTKSGGNSYSGSGFYFGRDRRLNARNAFAREKPPFSQQRYGGSLGGPIVRNRTHFFMAAEYNDVDRMKILAHPASNPFAAQVNGIYPAGSTNTMVNFKLDHRFNDSHSMFVRFALDDQKALRVANRPSDEFENDDVNRAKSLIAEENWMVSQRAVNTLRVHFLDHVLGTEAHSDGVAISRPSIQLGRNPAQPQSFPRKRLELYDTFYLSAANHDFKIGGDVAWGFHGFDAHFFEKGMFTFTTDAPFNAADSRTWPISFVMQKPGFYEYDSLELAAYVQDTWRLGDRVRLNLGLRYDYDANMRLNDFYSDILADPAFAGLERFRTVGDAGTDSNNLQPRAGFTWDATGQGNLVVRGGWGMYVSRNRGWFQLRSKNQFGSSAVRIEDPQALRLYPDINAVLGGKSLDEFVASGPRQIDTLIPDDYVLPYSLTSTAGVGWQLSSTTSLDIDYVHSVGDKQFGLTDRNLPASGAISAANPRPMRQFTQVLVLENFSKSWYDALETQLRTRVAGQTNLQVSYTLSRSYLDGVDFWNSRRGTERTPQERGYNVSDQRHNLTVSGSTTLPWGVQVSGIVKAVSGSPLKVQAGFDLDGDGSVQSDRPAGLPTTVGREKVEESLTLINTLRASRGLSPIDADLLQLDPYFTLDIRATKAIGLGAQRRLELFLEGYNITNRVNYEPFTVTGNINSPAFLIRRTARDARQIQWGVRYAF
ncbi:MAG: carboxypeptidase regulatory-like domain-containing protein [Vicinamibacterales bacterium]